MEKSVTMRFNKPLVENFSLERIVIGSQYLMLCGDFGKMTISRQAWEENVLQPPLPKKRALQEKQAFDWTKVFSWFRSDDSNK